MLKEYVNSALKIMNDNRDISIPGLFTFYAVLLIGIPALFAVRYTPPAGPGVQGFHIYLFLFQFFILYWFHRLESKEILTKTLLFIPARAVVTVFLISFIAIIGTNGHSNAFLGIMLVYAVLLALAYEIYCIPIEPDNLEDMNNSQLEFYAMNWRFAIRLILTASVAIGVGIFYKGLTTDNLVPLHLMFLLGLPGLGILIVILRLLKKIWAVRPYLQNEESK